MPKISQMIQQSDPCPRIANQQKLWRCANQARVGAVIEGLGRYENWTDMPATDKAMQAFGDQIEDSAKNWDQLSRFDLELLTLVLSRLRFSATYYVLTWLEYRADSQESPSMKIAQVAREMQKSDDEKEAQAGQRMWERISTLVKIASAQGVLADSMQQKIMVD